MSVALPPLPFPGEDPAEASPRRGWLWLVALLGAVIAGGVFLLRRRSSLGGGSPGHVPEGIFFLLALPLPFAFRMGVLGNLRRPDPPGRERLEEGEAMMFLQDSETGLYTRGFLAEHLRNSLSRSLRSLEPVTLLLFRLEPGDTPVRGFGPGEDPVPWRQLARILRSGARCGDLLGRIRVNEFLLLPSGPLPCAVHLIHRLLERVRRETGIRLRAGLSRSPEDGSSPYFLIEAARAALGWDVEETP